MDCLIPGHAIRPFCAAIGCLSRVGKDLIVEFDAVDGLTLRALSDSKAVFGSFHYEPSFFTKCSTAEMRKRKRTEDDDSHWCVRVAMKSLAAVVRPRKDLVSLQLVSVGDFLAFEFQIQRPEGVITRITHRVGVTKAQSIAPVAIMDMSSELVVQPSVVLPMLEPLKRSTEMVLLINETHRLISGASFAHGDISSGGGGSDALTASKHSTLKTETSIGFDELVDFHYVSFPSPSTTREEGTTPPHDLKEQVVLVFTTKEFRAMLDFAAKSHFDQELPVTLHFYWGGIPMVVTTKSQGFSAELVMATLDHKLLGSIKVAGGGE
jgi:hypothetical protein